MKTTRIKDVAWQGIQMSIPSVFTKFLLHLVTNYFIIQISSQGVTQEDKTVLMHEEVRKPVNLGSKNMAWIKAGAYEAIRIILTEKNTLFESLIGKLNDYPALSVMLRALLFTGKSITYNSDESAITIATMLGFIYNHRGEKQLVSYLDDYHVDQGYMISF